MTNWYQIFYWLTVADGVKQFFDVASSVFQVFTIISFILLLGCSWGVAYNISDSYIETKEDEDKDPDIRAWKRIRLTIAGIFYTSLILCVITWIGYVVVPSKKDALIIIAGGAVGNFVTKDSSAKQIPSEVMLLLRTKIKQEIKETSLKEVVNGEVDTLKNKTPEQLREIIKNQQK